MGKKLLIATLFLLSTNANGMEIKGESGFYTVNFKEQGKNRIGFEKWNGRKKGFFYNLEASENFKLKKGTFFKLSLVTGNPKLPYNNLFTCNSDRIYLYKGKEFNVRELFLFKKHFLFKNLALKVGKQNFDFSPLLNDHLWGGKFTYKINPKIEISYYQVAGYEGRYLLFSKDSEDDVDIFGPEISYKGNSFKVSIAGIRISDSKGKETGINKNNLLLKVKNSFYLFTASLQNGKVGTYGKITFNPAIVEGFYFEKGFTSYGYREGIPQMGIIFQPSVSESKGIKVSLRETFKTLTVSPYLFTFWKEKNEREAGIELDTKEGIFLQTAFGSGRRWGVFGGYKWEGIPKFPKVKVNIRKLKVKNLLSIEGEYGNFVKKPYSVQEGYEKWDTAKHVGFWHSTYKLRISSENLNLQVSTGPNSKRDYIVWGNTGDNFLYQKEHGKLWHLEETSYTKGMFKVGLQKVSLPGLFSDFLTGITLEKGIKFGVYRRSKKGDYLSTFRWKIGNLISGTFFRKDKNKSNKALILCLENKNYQVGVAKESGKRKWGTFGEGSFKTKIVTVNLLWEVYSKSFENFDLREDLRNVGYIFRPSQRDVRFYKVTLSKKIKSGVKNFDRLKPKIELLYDKFKKFSGKYVGEEGGVILNLKPGKLCTLSLIETLGNRNSQYTGIRFLLKW